MATKKKAKNAEAAVVLPEVTGLPMGQSYATSKAVSAEQAMEHIAQGWVLTLNDGQLIVVACPHDVHDGGH